MKKLNVLLLSATFLSLVQTSSVFAMGEEEPPAPPQRPIPARPVGEPNLSNQLAVQAPAKKSIPAPVGEANPDNQIVPVVAANPDNQLAFVVAEEQTSNQIVKAPLTIQETMSQVNGAIVHANGFLNQAEGFLSQDLSTLPSNIQTVAKIAQTGVQVVRRGVDFAGSGLELTQSCVAKAKGLFGAAQDYQKSVDEYKNALIVFANANTGVTESNPSFGSLIEAVSELSVFEHETTRSAMQKINSCMQDPRTTASLACSYLWNAGVTGIFTDAKELLTGQYSARKEKISTIFSLITEAMKHELKKAPQHAAAILANPSEAQKILGDASKDFAVLHFLIKLNSDFIQMSQNGENPSSPANAAQTAPVLQIEAAPVVADVTTPAAGIVTSPAYTVEEANETPEAAPEAINSLSSSGPLATEEKK